MPLTLPALNFNTARFVDVNNDGHLDMVLGTQLYLSDGSGHFINRPTALPGIGSGGTSWGDFDNDGFLDVAVAGDLNPLRLYRNEGGTNFALVATLGSYGWSTSVMAWGDCDNDGRLDLAFCDGNSSCVIYHNDGNGQFHDIRAKLPDLYAPAFAWGDFDNDGRLDFVLAGQGWVTLVYRNEGEGAFTMVNRSLAGVDHANAWWGDFDNDGQLDLLLCGFNFDLNQINRIYHNNGSGLFTDIQAPFSGYLLAGGDYDNDGYLDVFSYGPPHALYHNQGTNAFTNSNLAFPASSYSTMAWGDYDNDGRLDILLSGDTGTRLLRNNALTSNAPPAAPTSLQATVRSNAVVLSWGAASDANQAGALTYNVRVGTTPGGCQVVSPMADAATGLRRLPALGNAGECLSSFLLNLPRGVYYWSVQAIDNAFAGSAFAPEQVFPVSPPVLSPIADQVLLANGPALTVTFTVADGETAADALQLTAGSSNTNLVPQANLSLGGSGTNRTLTITQVPPFLGATTIRLTATDAEGQSAVRKFVVQAAGLLPVPNPFTPFYSGAAAWGDYDGDGRLDVVIYGMDEFEHARTRLFHNEGSGRFSLVRAPFLEINADAAAYGGPGQNVAWGDYDRDGDLDLLVSGGTWYQTSTRLYRNDGLDTDGLPVFTEVEAGLPTDLSGAVSFGDFDQDGDLDVLLGGNRIYENDGQGHFTITGIALAGSGSACWLDVDGDGRLDIALADRVLRNNGHRTFSDLGLHLPPLGSPSGAWGDFNSDGLPDLLVSGSLNGTNPVTRIYRNDRAGGFVDINAGLPSVQNASLSWVDFDNDGLLDACVSGNFNGEPADRTRLFRNNGSDTFTDVQADLPGAAYWYGTTSWADYDGDGRCDALLLGSAEAPLRRNYNWLTNQAPAAPATLASVVTGNAVRLSWTAAADPNQSAGLTYNIRVGTAPEGGNVVSPMSVPGTGFRQLPQPGNAGGRLAASLRSLAPGTYYWSVQAIDHSLAGSPFAPEQAFVVADVLAITCAQMGTNGVMELELSTAPGRSYALEASPDLQSWGALQTNLASGGSLVFTDAGAPHPGVRFYRVRRVP